MADTYTTHLNLVKQDPNTVPDYQVGDSNLDTLDTEIWARGKRFNGTAVSEDGEFHVNSIPYAENLETSFAQKSEETYIIRSSGGEASINNGDAWLTTIKGNCTHTGFVPQSVDMTVTPMEREEGEPITATIDEDTFVSYVESSGTTTLTYSTAWSADPSLYGITVTGTPIAGDVITVVYVKEERGTITQSNPQKFVSTGWNLYDHSNARARVVKYSDLSGYGFKISGTYSILEFSETLTGARTTITPVSGYFAVPSDGYVFVTGGSNADTAIWMTWSDWGTTANGGVFAPYVEYEVDFSTFMSGNFPYGLLAVGTVRDEINFNTGTAISRVERQAYTDANLANAKASGRQYEYDENYIYLERASDVTYTVSVEGVYTADDHGMEWFTGTDVAVFAETIYGANLKNKLERDVLTISQQTLTSSEQSQVRTNIGAASVDIEELVSYVDVSTVITDLDTIKLNSKGRLYLGASVSPTGANSGYSYLCVGVDAGKTLIVWSSLSNKEWTNSKTGSGWSGWHSTQDDVVPQKVITDSTSSTSRTLNIGNSARFVLCFMSNSSNAAFLVIVSTTTTGGISLLEAVKGSEVTFNTSTANKLVITHSTARAGLFLVFASSKTMLDGITLA